MKGILQGRWLIMVFLTPLTTSSTSAMSTLRYGRFGKEIYFGGLDTILTRLLLLGISYQVTFRANRFILGKPKII